MEKTKDVFCAKKDHFCSTATVSCVQMEKFMTLDAKSASVLTAPCKIQLASVWEDVVDTSTLTFKRAHVGATRALGGSTVAVLCAQKDK